MMCSSFFISSLARLVSPSLVFHPRAIKKPPSRRFFPFCIILLSLLYTTLDPSFSFVTNRKSAKNIRPRQRKNLFRFPANTRTTIHQKDCRGEDSADTASRITQYKTQHISCQYFFFKKSFFSSPFESATHHPFWLGSSRGFFRQPPTAVRSLAFAFYITTRHD